MGIRKIVSVLLDGRNLYEIIFFYFFVTRADHEPSNEIDTNKTDEVNAMEQRLDKEMEALIDRAAAGDQRALETILGDIQDMIFNLSLRMLGTIEDAEDASQEIMIKVMTHLSAFRKESRFTTWVFRIAVNHLQDYRKNMFSHYPLSFGFYGEDIANGGKEEIPDLTQGVEQAILAEELKMSCTNVMLQCLDRESRCIFILGTMFQVDSRIAGDILGITAQAYRQRLSRVRKKMAEFMDEYCGLSGKGMCSCKKRVNYAIASKRLNPRQLSYSELEDAELGIMEDVKNNMEKVDELALAFTHMPYYRTSANGRKLLRNFLNSETLRHIAEAKHTPQA